VHSVKGLEFDVVFLIGMVEGVFPDYRAQTGTRQMKEEQNEAFVAMTRARRLLYVTYPKSRVMPWGDRKAQQVSRFVTATKIYPVSAGGGHVMRVAE
jgi:DNA helicase-2/ATP-dependent DNA helicase PcrA